MRYKSRIFDTYASVSGLSTPLNSKYQALSYNLGPILRTIPTGAGLLDIGSGQGELLTLCHKVGVPSVGVDISSELVNNCQQRGLPVTLISDLCEFLSSSTTIWSAISMIDVLEHFTRDEVFEIVDLVSKRLAPNGGKFIVQVPNMQSPFAALNLYHDLTHEWGYTEASMRQLLGTCGFRNVRLYPQNYPPKGVYLLRHALRTLLYSFWKAVLLIDQPSRGSILTPNLIAVAEL